MVLKGRVNGWVDARARAGPSSLQPQEWLWAGLSTALCPVPGWFWRLTVPRKQLHPY